MNELAEGVYWTAPDHATDRPALGAICGDDATLMVDAGASARHAGSVLDGLATVGAPPLRAVVLTHAHWDHVFGAAAIAAPLIATRATRDELATMATWSWDDAALDGRVEAGHEIAFCRDMIKAELSPQERAELIVRVPEQAFDSEAEVELGNRMVRIVRVGGDHASDSCIVVVPGVVAFLGDCAYHNLHVEPNFYTRRRTFPLLDRLLALDVAHYVLGHDDAPLPRAEFAALATAMKAAGAAVARHGEGDAALEAALQDAVSECDDDEIREYVKLYQAGRVHEDA